MKKILTIILCAFALCTYAQDPVKQWGQLYNPQNEMFGHFQTRRPFQQNETSSQSPANFSFSSLT